MSEHANIHEAINAIMQEVGYVQKESSRGLNYSYASEAALIQALRPVMVKHGVYCYAMHYEPTRDGYETSKGTSMTSTIIAGEVRFVHAPSETHIDVGALGEGADPGDKSANKAMTGLLKYALRQTFLIETGDDPDSERPEQAHGVRRASGRKSADNGAQRPRKHTRPLEAPRLRDFLRRKAADYASNGRTVNDKQRGLCMGMLNECFATDDSDDRRRSVLAYVFEVDSGTELTDGQVLALLDWLNVEKDSGGAYTPDGTAVTEAGFVVRARMEEIGQDVLFPEEAA